MLDEKGEIAAAYPYSSKPTIHRVNLGGKNVFANCAVDALGIPFMIRKDAVVTSECFRCKRPIKVVILGTKLSSSEPSDIQVWLSDQERSQCALNFICPSINFFCSRQHLDEWKKVHPNDKGQPLTIEEAVQAGKVIFDKFLQ